MKLISLIFAGLFTCCVFLSGCGTVPVHHMDPIWYFPYTSEDFTKNLIGFLNDHPDMEVVSIVGNGTDVQSNEHGYFVVFKKKSTTKESGN